MNKNEILEQARKENKNRDPFELEVTRRGSIIGNCSAIAMMLIFFTIDFFLGGLDLRFPCVMCTLNAGSNLYCGIRLKKSSQIILGVTLAVLAVILAVICIINFTDGKEWKTILY